MHPHERKTRSMSSANAGSGDCWYDPRKSSALDCNVDEGFIMASDVEFEPNSLKSGLSAKFLVLHRSLSFEGESRTRSVGSA